MTALFLDILPVGVGATNDALEVLYKSTHDHDDGIWNPHESPLIRRLVELFTQRGIDRLAAVKKGLADWQSGAHYRDGSAPIPRPGMMSRWSKDELALVKVYLDNVFPGEWTLEDHMLAVEYLFQRYLPADELVPEAQWAATKASLMGKVQANLTVAVTTAVADKILAALPGSLSEVVSQFSLSGQQKAALEFANARTAENVVALADSARHQIKAVIIGFLEDQQANGPQQPGQSLDQRLFDKFATLNRDWRRIAVTEAGEAQTQGYIASLQPGAKVKRVEQYANACAFCKKIDGVEAIVVAPGHPQKDDNHIWPGKNNIGRSASPMRRVGGVLVPRTKDEMWWLPSGLAHPHCRGRWVPVVEDMPGEDKEFGDWMRGVLGS